MLLSAWPHLIHAILKTNRFATSTPYLNSLKLDHSLRVNYKTKMNGEPPFQNVERYGACHVPSMMALVDRSLWKFPEIWCLLRGLILVSCLVLLSWKVTCVIIVGVSGCLLVFFIIINVVICVYLCKLWVIPRILKLTIM